MRQRQRKGKLNCEKDQTDSMAAAIARQIARHRQRHLLAAGDNHFRSLNHSNRSK